MNSIQKLVEMGQSIWYDNIQRHLLESGEMEQMIKQGLIRGVTSNPSIFNQAIAKSADYDSSLLPMAWSGWSSEKIFYQLAIEDIRAAADLFQPLYKETKGGDGYVSLEVNPYLANDTQGTINEARRLWSEVNRPNLMVKIPATEAGIPAIREAIAAGININVTLIFSRERYAKVMDAYLGGLEDRLSAGLPIGMIASVASFFVSRVDTKVDPRLEEIIRSEGPQAEQAAKLLGKAAIANARLAYVDFEKVFSSGRFDLLKSQGARFQRPLWASTGTKNPAYSDVLYVEELIGPHTVNTVPPQTLTAFHEHGKARLSVTEFVDQARTDLSGLAGLGIQMDEITRQLEVEGVKAFSDAMTALLNTIDIRRKAAIEELGALQPAVAARVAGLASADVPHRFWAHDPGLWTENKTIQDEIRKRMGWIEAPGRGRAMLPDLARLVKEVRSAGYTHVLLVGMGGSSLAAEVLRDSLGVPQTGSAVDGHPALALQILDSTDPGQVRAAARWSLVETTLYIVSSKSGTTSEINAALDYFWSRAHNSLGEKAAEHFIAITDPGSALDKLARERKFRRVVAGDPSVGGRYAALTAFGLVPAALLGLDVGKLLERVEWMVKQCEANVPAERNPGLVLGAVLSEAFAQGRDKLTLLADPKIAAFGSWIEQMIAGSSGKQGKGILPANLEPALKAEKYSADRVFIYFRVDGEMKERAEEIRKAGQPVLTFTLRDGYDLGAQFLLWEVAAAVACIGIGVNPFDQPDVQDSKDRTTQKVKSFKETRKLDEGEPIWEGAGGRVYGWNFPGLNGAKTLADVVRTFTDQAHEGEYIAIQAYVPRGPRTFNRLQQLRSRILQASGRATTLGFGPRFLHIAGQLHKGGANNGLFLQITQRPSSDLEIPGEKMTFGILERAQALGDLEALLSRNKRAIRIHLVDGEIKDLIG